MVHMLAWNWHVSTSSMPSHACMTGCQVGHFPNCVTHLRRSSSPLSHSLLIFTPFSPLTLGIILLNLLSICNSAWVQTDLSQLSHAYIHFIASSPHSLTFSLSLISRWLY